MSGFEYSAAAAMVQFGLIREGYMVVLAASDRYDGKLRHGMTYGWDITGNPFGDDECGKYYAPRHECLVDVACLSRVHL